MSILKGVKNKVWQACTAKLPTGKSKPLLVNFQANFTKLPKSKFLALIEETSESDVTLSDRLPDYIHDWKMPAPDGGDVPFSKDNLEEALDDLDYSRAFMEGFHILHFGKEWKNIKTKN